MILILIIWLIHFLISPTIVVPNLCISVESDKILSSSIHSVILISFSYFRPTVYFCSNFFFNKSFSVASIDRFSIIWMASCWCKSGYLLIVARFSLIMIQAFVFYSSILTTLLFNLNNSSYSKSISLLQSSTSESLTFIYFCNIFSSLCSCFKSAS